MEKKSEFNTFVVVHGQMLPTMFASMAAQVIGCKSAVSALVTTLRAEGIVINGVILKTECQPNELSDVIDFHVLLIIKRDGCPSMFKVDEMIAVSFRKSGVNEGGDYEGCDSEDDDVGDGHVGYTYTDTGYRGNGTRFYGVGEDYFSTGHMISELVSARRRARMLLVVLRYMIKVYACKAHPSGGRERMIRILTEAKLLTTGYSTMFVICQLSMSLDELV
jgi:hypothetical protein